MRRALLALLAAALAATAPAAAQTQSEVLAASQPEEWASLAPDTTLVMELTGGREVVIALAPRFAPNTTANILTLVDQHYFDGLSINRAQDNYVVQWGDPSAEGETRRPLGAAAERIDPEYVRPRRGGPQLVTLPDGDVYARTVGFADGFPVAANRREMWLAHCYGMVGVGRDVAPDSGSGAELYAIIGHAPRHLDRNITLVGRVVWGIEHFSVLPRGTGALGFYETAGERTGIVQVRRLAQTPPDHPARRLEALRSDSASFEAMIEARRNRRDDWYIEPAGKIELCNVALPVRVRPAP